MIDRQLSIPTELPDLTLRTFREEDAFVWAELTRPFPRTWYGKRRSFDTRGNRELAATEMYYRMHPNGLALGAHTQEGLVARFELTPRSGGIALTEIGYEVAQPFRQRGYGSAGARAAAQFALSQLGVQTVFARISEFNVASQRTAMAAGFEETGSDGWAIGEYDEMLRFTYAEPLDPDSQV